MFRFHGGQTVEKGTYWNLSSGERTEVRTSMVLPGGRNERYTKLPAFSVFIAGPLAGLLFTIIIPFLFLFVLLTLLPRSIFANEAIGSDEARACLSCHAAPGMTMTFADKTALSVQVEASHFKNTVHAFLSCTGCHSTVSLDNHPSVQYGTKQEFIMAVAGACKTCHADEQIMANPLHKRAIQKANAPPCSDCHGSHSISKIPTQKEKQSTTQYCLTCHSQHLCLSLNGESLSLSIDEAELRNSVHAKHGCIDCHTTHSKAGHPKPKFKNIRQVSLSVAEACKRCHIEKWEQHRGSIHYSLISQGNQEAPVCSDCHGSHAVGPTVLAETMKGVPCRKCHGEIFLSYEGSVHGRAKGKGSGSAPICSSCHFAHDIKQASVSRSPRKTCFSCHPDVIDAHREWLPNAEAHFDSVACTACHVARDLKRSIYFRVTDETGAMVADSRVDGALGKTASEKAGQQEYRLKPEQLWSIYRKLNEGTGSVSLSGTVSLNDSKHAHGLLPKAKAVRQCEFCHTADAESFSTVSITTAMANGAERHYSLDAATFGSIYAMLPLAQFYAMGSTRIWLLDVIGAAMIAGGVAIPAIHGGLRFLTRKRREKKSSGGKETRP